MPNICVLGGHRMCHLSSLCLYLTVKLYTIRICSRSYRILNYFHFITSSWNGSRSLHVVYVPTKVTADAQNHFCSAIWKALFVWPIDSQNHLEPNGCVSRAILRMLYINGEDIKWVYSDYMVILIKNAYRPPHLSHTWAFRQKNAQHNFIAIPYFIKLIE